MARCRFLSHSTADGLPSVPFAQPQDPVLVSTATALQIARVVANQSSDCLGVLSQTSAWNRVVRPKQRIGQMV